VNSVIRKSQRATRRLPCIFYISWIMMEDSSPALLLVVTWPTPLGAAHAVVRLSWESKLEIYSINDSVYSGVVFLWGLWSVIFLGKLNELEPWATDIGNAYLEATTKEKVCIRAGSEFRHLECHLLIVYKAVYGLKSSGLRFNLLIAKCLRKLGFVHMMCESEIWIRKLSSGLFYEYINEMLTINAK